MEKLPSAERKRKSVSGWVWALVYPSCGFWLRAWQISSLVLRHWEGLISTIIRFALIAEEGFLISSCHSLELCIRCLYLSFFPLLFACLLFTAICKASPDSHFAFLHFFSMGMVLIPVSCTMSRTSFHSTSYT